jgi:hypothetical protein
MHEIAAGGGAGVVAKLALDFHGLAGKYHVHGGAAGGKFLAVSTPAGPRHY